MQRADFIYLSEYTATTLALPAADTESRQQIDIETTPFFLSNKADTKTIIDTGKAYCKAHKSENNKNTLAELLLANSDLNGSSDSAAILAMLKSKVKNDFKAGKTATVMGWVLSLTEARECALFSILQS